MAEISLIKNIKTKTHLHDNMVEAVEATSTATIKKQIEYYLSDANLTRDRFFREQIQTDKEGWVDIAHFLNCNKVKSLSISSE